MIAAASSTVRVLVGTTDGPAEIISLHRESAIVRRSIICVGGKRAGIDRGYNEFVSRKTGVIERAFGSAVFRIDVSHPIDAGSSWQLGFFVAHALSMAHRLAVDDCKHDVVVWASGTVRNSDLSVGGIGYVTQKLNLSLDRLRAEALAGNRVFVVLPAANTPEIDAELQRSLEATGARLLEIENVGQLLRELALPPVTLEAAAADKIWSGSPFRGLQPFESEHREIYYGRGRAREEALERLRRTASRGVAFLLIHGRSGAGKSSLVRAGLVGDIHRSANAAWRQSIFTPLMDGSPLRSLGRAIISGIPELSSSSWDEDRLVQSLLANNADVINAVRKGLAATSAIRSYQLLLFVDQLDELLLWANESADDRARVDEREAFANTLLALCRTGVVWTISTLRSDLLALLEDSPALSRLAVDDRLYRLERPTRVELKEIIVRPAQAARLTLDGADPTGLPFSEVLIEAASTAPDSLPLLQFVLARLFELEGTAGRVTFAAYDRLGRLEGAIGRWAEDTVQTLVDQGVPEKVIEQTILALSQIDRATGTVSARLVPIGQDAEHKLLKNVLVELTRRRLVVIDESGKARVAHEAVLTHWPRAKALFEAASRDLSSRDLLEAEADNWWQRDCDVTLLILAGRRLNEAEELRSAQRVFLSEVALKYLAACQVADRLARIRTRRVQAFIYVLLVGIIAGLVGWINQSYLKEQMNWYTTMRPYMLTSVRPYVLTTEAERALKPGQAFRECAKDCPEMIVIPAGSFMMGSPATEKDRLNDEGPQHQVTIARPFAVAKFELTFDEWDTCAAYGDCSLKISDAGYGRDRQPVINVTWEDTQIYVKWLKRMTGKPYRLLTEAEREYVTRAGTTTAFWWGASISLQQANYDGNFTYGGPRGEYRQRTLPVDSFQPNPWGLYQVHGNVWEWTEDCYHERYSGAPKDGSAWITGDCSRRVLRGGSWGDDPRNLRAAVRLRLTTDSRGSFNGFRVGRTLTP